nr:hypothetical protein [Prevotella sp.]
MNKKVYIQPQVWTISTYAECSAPLTGSVETKDNTEGGETGPTYGGTGNDLGSKEHFNDFDSWDSWD